MIPTSHVLRARWRAAPRWHRMSMHIAVGGTDGETMRHAVIKTSFAERCSARARATSALAPDLRAVRRTRADPMVGFADAANCRFGDQMVEDHVSRSRLRPPRLRCVAAPVGFADSWMVMGEFGREFNQLDAMFSPTARYSIAGTLTQMEKPIGARASNLAVVHYNRLLWRHNGPESQFNGYLSVGAGLSRSNAAFQRDRDQAGGGNRRSGGLSKRGSFTWRARPITGNRRTSLSAITACKRASLFTRPNGTKRSRG